MPNSKYWCFTDFDCTLDRHKFLQGLYPQVCNQLVYQEEVCGSTERHHFQGFIGFSRKISLTEVKRLLQSNLHVESVKKSIAAAQNYCMKADSKVSEGMEFSAGINKVAGSRTDLLICKDLLDKGISDADLYESHFETSAANYRFFDRYRLAKASHRMEPPEVIILYGPTGTGKTRWVYDNFTDVYSKDPTNKWWDGYRQNQCILIDEFHCNLPLNYMLRLLDRYPMTVETKGGSTVVNSPTIVITTNLNPTVDFYSECDHRSRAAFFRRVTSYNNHL